jgi:hypothetical protein
VPRDVVLDFGLERLLQHLQRSSLQHLVQRTPQFLVFLRRLLDYSQHGWRLLLPAINRDVCIELHTKDTPPSSVRRSTTFGYISLAAVMSFEPQPDEPTADDLDHGLALGLPLDV